MNNILGVDAGRALKVVIVLKFLSSSSPSECMGGRKEGRKEGRKCCCFLFVCLLWGFLIVCCCCCCCCLLLVFFCVGCRCFLAGLCWVCLLFKNVFIKRRTQHILFKGTWRQMTSQVAKERGFLLPLLHGFPFPISTKGCFACTIPHTG